MHRLRTLGAIELMNDGGEAVDTVLHQPKRVALLVFLILGNGSYLNRERVLGTFWPELPPKQARNNLRQALHFLRTHLPGVLAGRGRGDVGVDKRQLQCDARLFQDLIAQERHREALDLYAGPLLDGFSLGNSAPFDHWLDTKREELCQRAVAAAWSLVEVHRAKGETGLAAYYAKQAAELDGSSEGTARRAMKTLIELGDHIGAIHVYKVLSQKLMSLFGEEPSRATESIADGARRRSLASRPSAEDRAAIEILMNEWVQCIREGRYRDAAQLVTEDAVMMPPQEPMVRGRDGVEAFLASRPPLVDMQFTLDEVTGTGMQLTYRTTSIITVDVGDGQLVTMKARAQSNAERQPDGRWLAVAIMWNLAEPGPVV